MRITHTFRVDATLQIKVADFGLARDIYTADYYRTNTEARVPVKWMSPETLKDGFNDEKTDIVSEFNILMRQYYLNRYI